MKRPRYYSTASEAKERARRALRALYRINNRGAQDITTLYHAICIAVDELGEAERLVHQLPDSELVEPIPEWDDFAVQGGRAGGSRPNSGPKKRAVAAL